MIKFINFIIIYFLCLIKCFCNNIIQIQIFSETSEIYNNISLPYINSIYKQNILWIHNILFKNNNNLVLYKNNNIIIIKDNVFFNNNFYILALPYIQLKTIRDLRNHHLPLLYEMKNKIINIAKLYNISRNQLYIYFHYHPSYYYLHLHGCIITHPLLDSRYLRNYFIDDVIENLKINNYYYKYKTLKFELKSNNQLFNLLMN